MLTASEYAQLKNGQAMLVDVARSPDEPERIVQIVPIRGRHSGRIVRYSVTIPKRGRGTVAR